MDEHMIAWAKVCPDCAALVYGDDPACEETHRSFHAVLAAAATREDSDA